MAGGKSNAGPSFFAGVAFGWWMASLALLFGLLHEHVQGNLALVGAPDTAPAWVFELILAAAAHTHTWTGRLVGLGVLAACSAPVLFGARGRLAARCYMVAAALTLAAAVYVYLGVEAAADRAVTVVLEEPAPSPPR